ncbi:MAG: spore coat U domain-containing protein [Pseudorhodobacter sp.]|nr:spore coat U domain-containing protein [Pseudorhodobacter sp.]
MLFHASAAIAQTCSFSASDIVFGQVDTLGSGATDTSGTVSISCSAFLGLLSSIEINIHIGEGRGGANGATRQMTSISTATPLNFQLYRDAARSDLLGGSYWSYGGQPIQLSGSSILNLLTTTGVDVPVYARVPGNQSSVIPGSYSSIFDRNPIDVRVDYRTCNLLLLCTNRTATFSFTVLADVVADCLVVADDLSFGTTGLLNAAIDATSQIDVTCTANSDFDIGLGYGFYGTGPNDRQMRDTGGNQIGYGLYQDAARSITWAELGDGAAQPGTGSGAGQSFTVYGRVPAQPTPPPGSYSDTVVVTITY